MNQLHFTSPGAPIDEYAITLESHSNVFVSSTPNEIHQQKIASYAQDSSGTIVAGILAEHSADQLFIQGLWVSAAVRRRGAGTTLLCLLEDYAKEKSINTIHLEITNTQLMEFYVKNKYDIAGSKRTELRDGEYYSLKKILTETVKESS